MIAASWELRTRTLEFGRRPLIMAILNVTPDSFSDGGQSFTLDAALRRAETLVAAGADILDIGGESTRPYSQPVSAPEEITRVVPVIEAIVSRFELPVSIDTRKAEVARAALDLGVEIINDVTGLTGDPRMVDVARSEGAGVCVMHMQGEPGTMQDQPRYIDVVDEILAYLRQRRDALIAAGISASRICLDPGIGFGKEHHHNVTLLANAGRFHELGQPILVGHSRKGFIGKILGDKERDRQAGTAGVSVALAMQRIHVLRVHDVATTRDAIQLFDAVGGLDGHTWPSVE